MEMLMLILGGGYGVANGLYAIYELCQLKDKVWIDCYPFIILLLLSIGFLVLIIIRCFEYRAEQIEDPLPFVKPIVRKNHRNFANKLNKSRKTKPRGKCIICFDIKILFKIRDCSHFFCKDCIIEFTRTKWECPMCRGFIKRVKY